MACTVSKKPENERGTFIFLFILVTMVVTYGAKVFPPPPLFFACCFSKRFLIFYKRGVVCFFLPTKNTHKVHMPPPAVSPYEGGTTPLLTINR